MIDHAKSILLTIVMLASASGCDNNKAGGASTPSASASAAATSATPSASASSAPKSAPSSSGTTAPAAGAEASWAGSYKSEAGSIYVPTEVANGKDWKDVKWRGDLSNSGLGDGPMTLTIDPSGRVSGSLEGPLGPAIINGQLIENRVTATITRKNTSDGGFVGTLTGSVEDAKVTGTMKLSQREASVIRSATFSASKK